MIFNGTEDILDIKLDDVFKAAFTKDTPNSKTALFQDSFRTSDRRLMG